MLIAQISDTHILAERAEHPAAQSRADDLRRCIEDINRQRPDAVLFTGDTVQHGRAEEYSHLRELLEPLSAPLYVVPGNRDNKTELRTAFGDHTYLPDDDDFLHYSVEDHDVRLVAIDSTSPGERKGVFCPRRQDWLDGVLRDEPNQPTLLFIHHPPFDVDNHYIGGYRRPHEATALCDIVSDSKGIAALLCGHVHWPVIRDWAGTKASIMPSIAVDLRKGIDESVARGQPIYMLHRLSEETGIASHTRTLGVAASPCSA